MKNTIIFALICSLPFWLILIGFKAGYITCNVYPNSNIDSVEVAATVGMPKEIKWDCAKKIETCPWSDWRYTRAQDVCTYTHQFVYSRNNPATVPGETCKISK
jgi:hypothetical protein